MRLMCRALPVLLAMLAYTQLPAQEVKEKLVERFQELDLTDAQEAKITSIREESRPKVEAAAKSLSAIAKEEADKVTALLTPAQKEKLAELKEERAEVRGEGLSEKLARLDELDLTDAEMAQIRAIRKEIRPNVAKAMEQLRGTLTEEQRTARDVALQASKSRAEVLAAMKLSDDQKQKVREVGKEFRTSVRDELQKLGNLLDEQQKAKLVELKDERREDVRDRRAHRIANLKELNLTEDQRTKIAEIRTEYRPKVQEAGNKLRAAVRDEVKAIAEVVKG
jgi:Spy/CpxP family protein refolding chaperone